MLSTMTYRGFNIRSFGGDTWVEVPPGEVVDVGDVEEARGLIEYMTEEDYDDVECYYDVEDYDADN